ncbi:MAG: N-sulfoglucosamine sulfohydrolase [Planctomycetota bacterium]|jgi:N-sulfoglucosamine sulfohydrolase
MPQQKPNVLWIYGEDLHPDLGCYGTPVVHTPHIDQLAAEGAIFNNTFVTCPVCSPSRSAIITGRYQTAIGAHNHRSKRDVPLPNDVPLITDYFRAAGYYTCNSPGPGSYEKVGKTDFNFHVENPFDGTDWSQRAAGQPFYAQLNITDTHRNFSRDDERPIDPSTITLPPYYPDHPLARADWAQYLESIQVLDRKIGQAMQRLDEEDLSDSTMVFFIGDHGRAHVRDKQFLYDGGLRVPCIVRWPGHITAGTTDERLVSGIDFAATALHLCDLPVPENLDGRPFIDTAIEPRQTVFAARDRCDGTHDRIRCARTQRYKYIRNLQPERPYMQFNAYKKHQYPVWTLLRVLHERGELSPVQEKFLAPSRPHEELYDIQADPYELNNLAADSAHESARDELSAQLDQWMEATKDQGLLEEDLQVQNEEDTRMQHNFTELMQKRGLDPTISDADYLGWWLQRFNLMAQQK